MSSRNGAVNPACARALILVLLLVLTAGPGLAGCAQGDPGEGVAIYLLTDDTRPSVLPALSRLQLAAEPIVASGDLFSYSQDTHKFEVSADAFEAISQLQVSTEGKAFAVTVDGSPVYAGAMMTPLSSSSFDGVVIVQMEGLQAVSGRYWVRVDLGYPGPDWFKGSDPRNDAGLLKALAQAGKLK